jgi:hypothetical protein
MVHRLDDVENKNKKAKLEKKYTFSENFTLE